MSNINPVILQGRGVIAITGDDRKPFLQGLITNNIYKATQETALFSALLSPQGKFLYDFFIIEQGDVLLLEMDKASIAGFIKLLSLYKLRSRVALEESPDLGVAAVFGIREAWKSGSREIVREYEDPRWPDLGKRIIFPISRLPDFPTSPDAYDQHRISLTIPEGSKDLTYDRSLPMEWGYDRLNAIDFTKGCYVGQEVTARSKHRAILRKMPCRIEAAVALPSQGSSILNGEKEAGMVASVYGTQAIALIQKEAISPETSLIINATPVKAILPVWWKED